MNHPRSLLGALLLGACAFSSAAHAGGVLVRLDADRTLDGDVYVDLAPADGQTERVQLQDDGQQPDVTAGDGRWAGAVFLPHTDVTVSLVLDGERMDGGPAVWSAPDIPRDLDLTLRDGVLTVKAREANQHNPGEGPGGSGGGTAAQASKEAADAEAQVGLWLIGGGAVLFVGLAVMLVVMRKHARVRRGPISGVTLVPAGGFAGPGSPPLNDGLVHWRTDPAHAPAVLRALVDTLARHHGVLLVGDVPQHAGSRAGRRIFRATDPTPRKVGDALEAIHADPREAGVVVFYDVGGSPDDWADRDDELPLGTGGVVLHTAAEAAPARTHVVRPVGPGVCVVEATEGDARFLIGDRARWPASVDGVVVDQ